MRRTKAQYINVASGAVIENSEKPQFATTLQRVQNPQQNDPRKETPKSAKSPKNKKKKEKETSISKKHHRSKRAENGTKNRWVGTYLPTASKMRDGNRGTKERNLVERAIAGEWRTGTSLNDFVVVGTRRLPLLLRLAQEFLQRETGMVPISRKLKATHFRNLRYLGPAFFFFSLAIYISPK